MHDRDVERILRRYEPAGPREDLRARALSPRPAVRAWPWLAAAAALLAATVGFHAASHGRGAAGGMDDEDPGLRAALIAALGGDGLARARAEIFLAAQEARRQDAPAAPARPLPEAQ